MMKRRGRENREELKNWEVIENDRKKSAIQKGMKKYGHWSKQFDTF